MIYLVMYISPALVKISIASCPHQHGTKATRQEYVFREVSIPPPNYPFVGYSRVDTLNCTDPLCHLNRGRKPVRIREGQSNCRTISECVTLITKTRFRLTTVAHMIQSFWRYYPFTRVIVADDFNPEYPSRYNSSSPWFTIYREGRGNVTYVQTEEGIAQGRNMALRLATTKYVLLVDDDILFTNKTDLPTMLRLLEGTDASIIGGTYENGPTFDSLIRIHQTNASLSVGWYAGIYYQSLAPFAPCYETDCVHNFFMFNRAHILAAGAWDDTFQVYEHEDFFMTMRRLGIKIVYCPHITVIHDRSVSTELRNERLQKYIKFSRIRKLKWGYTKEKFCKSHKYLQIDECI